MSDYDEFKRANINDQKTIDATKILIIDIDKKEELLNIVINDIYDDINKLGKKYTDIFATYNHIINRLINNNNTP